MNTPLVYGRLYAAVLAALLAVVLASCSSTSKKQGGVFPFSSDDFSDASDAEILEFKKTENLYKQKDYNGVLNSTKAFVRRFPKSVLLDRIHFVRGLSYIQLSQGQHALINFRHVIQLTKDDVVKAMALYNKAYLEQDQGLLDDALASLEAMQVNLLDESNRRKFYLLSAKVHGKRKDPLSASKAILEAYRYSKQDSPELQSEASSMRSFLVTQIQEIGSLPAIMKLIDDYSSSIVLDELLKAAAQLSLQNDDRARAQYYAKEIIARYPNSPHYIFARDLLGRAESTSRANPARVGVVLTLSGKYAKFGYKALQGIQLAFGIFNKNNSTGLSLHICDDKGSEETASKCIDRLVDRDEVTAILGPLLSKNADAAALRAQDRAVPLISLTQKEAAGGNYIFNAALTPAMQVRELVRISKELTSIESYAIIAPSSNFGEEYASAFWDAAVASGSQIRGVETYPPNETDFRAYVDRLVGLAWPEARSTELEQLRQLKEAANLKINQKKLNKMFSLRPYVDFQAVFIPDDPKRLGQILPTFAYKDVDKMLFLGINTWNSPELLTRASQYAEGSVFVDAFFPGSTKPSVQDFVTRFQDTYGYAPSSIEAMAFDAGNMVVHVLLAQGASSRSSVRDKLASLQNFPGITGAISFIDGKLTKRLAVLTVRGGKIEEIAAQ
jgi:ABC-type branched-subunit amino acid transport system substrate-binding protein